MELIGKQFRHIRVTEIVGEGGMGAVYVGHDETLDRKVALKALHSDQRLDADARARLLREARALSKLEHPNICRIHDFLEEDGFDLLVLEYIDGRTLKAAIHDGLSRGEKLRIAVSLASALVAAHRAGIIHRDLKPDNVMITRTGEVKVLDFGLARLLRSSSTPRIRLRQRTDDLDAPSAPLTVAGTTMGTPIYMSPEQARGAELTPASDMYSFGLVLQTMFSGVEPHPAELSAREVMLRAARGETRPVKGIESGAAALIERLKQFAPSDRPTAVDAQARLRWIIDKPKRVGLRAAVAAFALLLTGGGWRYAVDLKAEQSIANAARTEAEERRAQAEGLIEFMLSDLRRKLEPVGRLDILDDVGTRALLYVDSLDSASLSAADLATNAKALNQLGEVRLAQGKAPEASELFTRSLRLADEAIRREPRNGDALLVHGAAHFWIGNSLRQQGKHDEALPHMRAYMKDGDALAKVDRTNRQYQLERAYGHSGVALILEAQDELHDALDHYQTSLYIKREIAEANPGDDDAQAELARAINKVGVVQFKLGQFQDARESSEREVALYRILTARQPKQAQWKNRLATAMGYLANVRNSTGDTTGAVTLWQEELAIERQLAALDPSNVSWQRNVAVQLMHLADAKTNAGNREALALFSESRAKIAPLIALAPTRTSLRADQWNIDTEYAEALVRFGEARRAIPLLRGVLEASATAKADDSLHLLRAQAAYHLGNALRSFDENAAEDSWRRAESELAAVSTRLNDPAQLEVTFRILLRRGRIAEATQVLSRIQQTGYSSVELEKLCKESGC